MQNQTLDLMSVAIPGGTCGLPGTEPGLDRQDAAGWVFGQCRNRTEHFFRSKPRPLAGHPDPLPILRTPESISDTANWPSWNGDLDNPNDSKDNCAADDVSAIEQKNCIEHAQCPSGRIWVTQQAFPDWFGQHRSQTDRLKWSCWRSIQSKRGGRKEWKQSWTECVNGWSGSLCSLTGSVS